MNIKLYHISLTVSSDKPVYEKGLKYSDLIFHTN